MRKFLITVVLSIGLVCVTSISAYAGYHKQITCINQGGGASATLYSSGYSSYYSGCVSNMSYTLRDGWRYGFII